MGTLTLDEYTAIVARDMRERGRNGLQELVNALLGRLRRERFPRMLWYHTQDSRRCPVGFPDLQVVIPETWRVIIAELKRERQRPTVEQVAWLNAYAIGAVSTACEVYLWRPRHLLSGAIERLLTGSVVWASSNGFDSGWWSHHDSMVIGDPYSTPAKAKKRG